MEMEGLILQLSTDQKSLMLTILQLRRQWNGNLNFNLKSLITKNLTEKRTGFKNGDGFSTISKSNLSSKQKIIVLLWTVK